MVSKQNVFDKIVLGALKTLRMPNNMSNLNGACAYHIPSDLRLTGCSLLLILLPADGRRCSSLVRFAKEERRCSS